MKTLFRLSILMLAAFMVSCQSDEEEKNYTLASTTIFEAIEYLDMPNPELLLQTIESISEHYNLSYVSREKVDPILYMMKYKENKCVLLVDVLNPSAPDYYFLFSYLSGDLIESGTEDEMFINMSQGETIAQLFPILIEE